MNRHLKIKNTIGTKVFGLAVFLLALTIVLVAVLLWQVTILNTQLEVVEGRYLPLANAAANLEEYGLRRRLAFERWYGALNNPQPNPTILAEARTNYDLFTVRLTAELHRVDSLADLPALIDRDREELAGVRTSVRQITALYAIIGNSQRQVLEDMKAGRLARVNSLIDILNDTQRLVQDERSRIQHFTQQFVTNAAVEASQRQSRIVWVSVAATLVSVLLGLTFSALVTRRLVNPVQSLIGGIKRVEQGDLTVELPVLSRDEVADLTRAFNYFVQELRAKDEIRQTFGKYIDPRVLDRVILKPGGGDVISGRREMCVAFADLVGFTALGEQLTPAGMVNVLNRHFALQAEVIQRHYGVIDKFMGDAIMAFWGPPFSTEEEQASQACRAALDQLSALDTFRSLLPDLTGLRKNLPTVDLRIGLSMGDVVVGNIGAENSRSYTVMGDTVNLASRLEHANRYYGTRILANESIASAAGAEFLTREIDMLVVKGKTEAHRVFEILGIAAIMPESARQLCDRFAAALSAYRTSQWDLAEQALLGCLELRRDDGPSRVFLDRIRRFRAEPPAAGWDGSYRLEQK